MRSFNMTSCTTIPSSSSIIDYDMDELINEASCCRGGERREKISYNHPIIHLLLGK